MISTVKKDWLLEVLKKNAGEHEGIFKEAVEGYRKEAVSILNAHIERIQRGELIRVYVALPEPENHTRDYERVISMVENTVEDEVELEESEYASYVLDDWNWKIQFLTTNSAYSASAARALK